MGTLSIKPRTPTKLQGIRGHGTGLRQSLVWAWWKTQALFALIDSKTPEDHDLDTISLPPVPPFQPQRAHTLPKCSLLPEKPEEPLPPLQRLWWWEPVETTKFKGEMAFLSKDFN